MFGFKKDLSTGSTREVSFLVFRRFFGRGRFGRPPVHADGAGDDQDYSRKQVRAYLLAQQQPGQQRGQGGLDEEDHAAHAGRGQSHPLEVEEEPQAAHNDPEVEQRPDVG